VRRFLRSQDEAGDPATGRDTMPLGHTECDQAGTVTTNFDQQKNSPLDLEQVEGAGQGPCGGPEPAEHPYTQQEGAAT